MQEEKLQKTGTTTVGIRCTDGVILAADRKATSGSLVSNKKTQKIFEIQPHIGITMAGLVGDAQQMIRIMKAETSLWQTSRKRIIEVEAAATLLSNILNYNRLYPYWVGHIVGGYDDGPSLYSLDAAGGLMIEEEYTSIGSGEPFAYGVLEDSWKKDKSVEENIPLAARAVKAAIERDVYSGGVGMTMLTITKNKSGFVPDKVLEPYLKKKG
jgi:proteasome beta subunit